MGESNNGPNNKNSEGILNTMSKTVNAWKTTFGSKTPSLNQPSTISSMFSNTLGKSPNSSNQSLNPSSTISSMFSNTLGKSPNSNRTPNIRVKSEEGPENSTSPRFGGKRKRKRTKKRTKKNKRRPTKRRR